MNGLGFDKYSAKYLSEVKRAAGTFPAVTSPWVIAKFTSDWFSLTNRKVRAVWPFIGGNADAHALDLFGGFPLTWRGTVTHNANGMTGNGSTGVGSVATSSLFPSYSTYSWGFYSRTTTAVDCYDMGNTGSGSGFWLAAYRPVAAPSYMGVQLTTTPCTLAVANGLGLFWVDRSDTSHWQVIKNASGSAIQNIASTFSPTDANFSIGGLGSGTYYSPRNIAFAFVNLVNYQKMNPAPGATPLYNMVQALQTHCGRQV